VAKGKPAKEAQSGIREDEGRPQDFEDGVETTVPDIVQEGVNGPNPQNNENHDNEKEDGKFKCHEVLL
jgi:hypothetical protein